MITIIHYYYCWSLCDVSKFQVIFLAILLTNYSSCTLLLLLMFINNKINNVASDIPT
jgi:hypothetical protein